MFEHEYLEYLAGYTLGALTPAEQRKLEEHLRSGCDLCEPELRILNATATRLPQGLPLVKMPAGLKDRLRDRLEKEGVFEEHKSVAAQPKVKRLTWLVAASLILAALAAVLYSNSQMRLNDVSMNLAEKQQQLSEMEKLLKQKDVEINWLRDPGVQLALLTGLAEASQARGKMIWNPKEHKGIFYVESLPPLTQKKSYQLWVIGARGPVSAGVFATDPRGAAVLTIARIEGDVEGPPQFAVTIEPYGGVPQPTTTPILLGKPL